jgi:hypothetical protein
MMDLWCAQVAFAKDFNEVKSGTFILVTADRWLHTHEAKPNRVPVWPNAPLTSWIQLRDFTPARRDFPHQKSETSNSTDVGSSVHFSVDPTSATAHLTEDQLQKWTAYRGPVR